MSKESMKALVTCEVTEEFLLEMKIRNIDVVLAGWGQTGAVLTTEEIVNKARECEIVIVEIEELSQDVLSKLNNLKFVGVSRGTPVNIDLDYCERNRIPVVYTPGRNADSVADYCLAMMLDLSRKLTMSSRHLQKSGWLYQEKLPYLEFRGKELGSLSVGLYGLGQIGAKVALRLNRGFGSKVYFYDPFVESSPNAEKVESLEELFEKSDVISLHAPVIEQTKNSINREMLGKLGPNGIFISSARAKLVVEDDLYAALKNKEIAYAALDVFWSEPIQQNDRWLQLPNVICTPHIAGASLNVISNHCKTILQGIDRLLFNNESQGG